MENNEPFQSCSPWDERTHQVPACFRQVILQALLPTILVLFCVLATLISSIPLFRRYVERLKKPWTEMADVSLAEDERIYHKVPYWKWAAFILGSLSLAAIHGHLALRSLLAATREPLLRSNLLPTLVWLYAASRVLSRKPVTPSYRILLLSLWYSVVYSLEINYEPSIVHTFQLLLALGLFALTISLPVCASHSTRAATLTDKPKLDLISPEESITLLSYWTFAWMNTLLDTASLGGLEDKGSYKLSPEFQHRNVFRAFDEMK